ncbi:MAG: glycosyltransferase family 39 protein [Acidobacteriota bacterium]
MKNGLKMPNRGLSPWRTATLLFTGALAVRVLAVAATGFDGLYGQDAYAYFDQAMALRAALLQGLPAPPGFHWPQGYPGLVALLSLAVGAGPWAAQWLSLLMGSLAASLTYLIGRRLFPAENHGAAVLAAVVTAIGGQAVLSSVVCMSDATAMALILLSMWIALRYRDAPHHWPLLVLAVITGGAAVATRWASLLVAPALAVPALAGFSKNACYRRCRPGLMFAAIALSGVGLVAVFSVEAFDIAGYFRGWTLFNGVWGPIPQIPKNSLAAAAPGLLYYLAPLYHPAFLGPLLGPLAFWGLWRLGRDHDRTSLMTLLLWAVIPYLFFIGLPLRNLRFCLTNSTAFILLGAYGAWCLFPRPILGRPTRALVILSLALTAGWSLYRLHHFTADQATIVRTVEAVGDSVPADAIILAFEITLALEHHSNLEVVELFDQDADDLQELAAGPRPLFLLTRPDDILERWHDQAPGLNTRWLEARGDLTSVGTWEAYRLCKFQEHPPTPVETPP